MRRQILYPANWHLTEPHASEVPARLPGHPGVHDVVEPLDHALLPSAVRLHGAHLHCFFVVRLVQRPRGAPRNQNLFSVRLPNFQTILNIHELHLERLNTHEKYPAATHASARAPGCHLHRGRPASPPGRCCCSRSRSPGRSRKPESAPADAVGAPVDTENDRKTNRSKLQKTT